MGDCFNRNSSSKCCSSIMILKLQNIDDILTEEQLDHLINLAKQESEIDHIEVTQEQKDYMKRFRNFGKYGKALSVNVVDGDLVADVDEPSEYRGITVTVV